MLALVLFISIHTYQLRLGEQHVVLEDGQHLSIFAHGLFKVLALVEAIAAILKLQCKLELLVWAHVTHGLALVVE